MTKSKLTVCGVFLLSFLVGNAVAADKKSDIGAYFILTQTITDPDKYKSEYIPQVLKFIAKHRGEIVVAKHDAEPLEGSPAKGVVVLRFPSEEAVRNFVNDPKYQPAKKIRHAITTNANAVLAPQFQKKAR